MKILLQSVPDGVDLVEIREKILQLEGVAGIHNFHIWSLDGSENICSLHIEMQENQDENILFTQINTLLEKDNIHNSTLQIEKAGMKYEKKN